MLRLKRLPLMRSLHTTAPEIVLTRDLFLLHPWPSRDIQGSFYPRSTVDFDSYYLDGVALPRYSAVQEVLRLDKDAKSELQVRTDRIQKFLGPKLNLSFEDLLCICCGLSNMAVDLPSKLTGSVFDKSQVLQDVLRTQGQKFFTLHSTVSTVFNDVNHLSASFPEIDLSLALFGDSASLLVQLMKNYGLYECVIPYKGSHQRHPPDMWPKYQTVIKDETSVGSFHTMLGILIARYGSGTVLDELWYPKVLNPNFGIVKIATEKLTQSSND